MGYYINISNGSVLPAKGKADILVANGATLLPTAPDTFIDNLVCVVDNGPFEAAGYCYDEKEMKEFLRPDGRSKKWLIVPDAAVLSGYNH